MQVSDWISTTATVSDPVRIPAVERLAMSDNGVMSEPIYFQVARCQLILSPGIRSRRSELRCRQVLESTAQYRSFRSIQNTVIFDHLRTASNASETPMKVSMSVFEFISRATGFINAHRDVQRLKIAFQRIDIRSFDRTDHH